MYVLAAPCILDPSCRAHGITTAEDVRSFLRAIERCRRFSIEMVPLPCPETIYLGADREPGSFMERLAANEFSALLDALEAGVRNAIRERGEPPLAIVGVDSSPACGVNTTYRSSEKEPGRGAFIAGSRISGRSTSGSLRATASTLPRRSSRKRSGPTT